MLDKKGLTRMYYLPYLMAQVIGYVIAGILAAEEGVWLWLPAFLVGGPLAAMIFRTMVVCYRLLRDIIPYTILGWLLSLFLSFMGGAGAFWFLLRVAGIFRVSTYAAIAFIDILALYFLYTDFIRFVRGEIVSISPKIQTVLIITCIILAVIIAITGLYGFKTGKYEKKEKNTIAETIPEDPMDASYFVPGNREFDMLYEQTLYSIQEEAEHDEKNFHIASPVVISAVYYLKGNAPDVQFKEYRYNVTISNCQPALDIEILEHSDINNP